MVPGLPRHFALMTSAFALSQMRSALAWLQKLVVGRQPVRDAVDPFVQLGVGQRSTRSCHDDGSTVGSSGGVDSWEHVCPRRSDQYGRRP